MLKMNVNAFSQKDYENEPPSGPKKQTQFKPNSNPVLSKVEGVEWANFRKAKMNLKSLAKKSGHTPGNPPLADSL